MLTGFDAARGDRRTIAEALRAVMRDILASSDNSRDTVRVRDRNRGGSGSRSRSGDSSGDLGYAELLEEPSLAAALLDDDSLTVTNLMSFTHLIAEKNSNT